jgi:hypothetical protein
VLFLFQEQCLEAHLSSDAFAHIGQLFMWTSLGLQWSLA